MGKVDTPENYLRVFVIQLENIMKMFLQHIQLVALSRRTVLLNRSFYWYRQVASSIILKVFH